MDMVIHFLIRVFLQITGTKYCQEYFPDFTTVEKLVFTIRNSKEGASKHMESLCKSGQLLNVVISKAPHQIDGENSHVTDPVKPEGSHFIATKNRDAMPSSCRGKLSHVTDPGKSEGSHFIMTKNHDSMHKVGGKASLGKPKGRSSTECYVTEEVNPIDKTCLSEKQAWFANTKNKAAAQLVSEGAGPSFSTCVFYMNSWTKEANDNDLKMTFIQGKMKAKGRFWKLIIIAEEPEGITAVNDEM